MKYLSSLLFLCLFTSSVSIQVDQIFVSKEEEGMKLMVNGEDFMVNGMNWDYIPIGTNYSFNLWEQSEEMIEAALKSEMSLLKEMGVNTIRVYTGIPSKWITYIYEKYGIYTMLNHPFGRYGVSIDGEWIPNTEYSDSKVKETLLAEVEALAEEYKNTSGLLMYLLGNENNYGLFWEGAETENIPIADKKSSIRAKALYKLFNEAALAMKAIDASHPIVMCNGEVQFIDLIAEECKDVDIFGTNVYRGESFGDTFQKVKDKLNKPILFTEFGSDAFNAVKNEEDPTSQAYYMVCNWQEIYENAAGLGKAGNAIGGFTFQFSDGWWKYGQTKNLEVHDNNASWSNGGYQNDFVKGKNNMNEEWFGICAKELANEDGLYQLSPRTAYYALKEAHQLNPYLSNLTLDDINTHFSNTLLNYSLDCK
ncbi:MAG: glycoside hydrolase family 2 TIM barrel-domain containing protein [Chitinophagales bacterium]